MTPVAVIVGAGLLLAQWTAATAGGVPPPHARTQVSSARAAAQAARPQLCRVWTDPSGDERDAIMGRGHDPQLDLIEGDLGLSADRSTLRVRLVVANLSATVPPGATEAMWRMRWQYGGAMYVAEAAISAVAPGVRYSDGQVVSVGSGASEYAIAHEDTGSFTTGSPGVVEIDVPLSRIGNPHGLLRQPAGETDEWLGLPTWLGTPADSILYAHRSGTEMTVDNTDIGSPYDLDTGRC